MIFDLLRLKNGIDKKVVIDETYSFTEEQLKGTDLSKLDDVHIEGEITLNSIGELYLSIEVYGTMIIPCAITLKPVEYPFDTVIEGDLSEINEEIAEKCINSIDIFPIIWENILMEIPMRVVSPDADITKLKGDGWRVITDEEENVNPELSKLEELLKTSEVK
jgi:uncharacterized protein